MTLVIEIADHLKAAIHSAQFTIMDRRSGKKRGNCFYAHIFYPSLRFSVSENKHHLLFTEIRKTNNISGIVIPYGGRQK